MSLNTLLTRNDFRELVFFRDRGLCVMCVKPATAAHHIVERRLFPDGGYYLNNGASLCDECHILAEETEISCDAIREMLGITTLVIPPHLYADQDIDKWGNPILPNGTRLKGELFFDESVQKILKQGGKLPLFLDRVKYPRTHHLPWSASVGKSDRIHPDVNFFLNKEVVITEKMDGENTSMYSDGIHARSLEYSSHESRNWVKALHSKICGFIPSGWRVCGENLYAKHSILYENLDDYFQVFSIWNEQNECLSWDQTVEWATLLDLKVVPIIWKGLWDAKHIQNISSTLDFSKVEGYVVRVSDKFHYRDFKMSTAKYVRKDHVQPEAHHWKYSRVVPNKIK